jgi:hypothetical protein
MPRRRLRPDTRARFDPELGVDMTIDLLIGPATFEADPTVEELAVAWELHGGG